MKTNSTHVNYLVEVETPYDNLMDVSIALCTLPHVQNVTLVGSDVILNDITGKLKRGLDGLEYQKEQRGE